MSIRTERVRVWTSGALGSNNCILDVSKQSTLGACWVEPSHFLVKGRFEMCLGLRRPWVFLHHELIVYFITHFFWSLSQSAAVKQAGHLSKPLFPGEKSCHLCMCHFCLAALSHLLAHFAQAGEICATCHCLPVWQRDWWNILSVMTTATDGVFTSLCGEKEDNGHESILFSPTDQERMG